MVEFFETRLDNGLRVVGERHPYGNAVSLGMGIMIGSRDEHQKSHQGIAHFIEHLIFKSTEKYTSFELVNALEKKGGDLNAFTSKDYTCIHSYGLKEDLPVALDVLSQLCFHANWSEEDFISEKRVVEQEIKMSRDNPEDYMFDDFVEKFFEGSSLAHPIFGDVETLGLLGKIDAKSFYDNNYRPEKMVLSISGNFEWSEFIKLVQSELSHISPAKVKEIRSYPSLDTNQFIHLENKSISQTHMILGCQANAITDGVHYPISLISNYLSGGMNSRLFRELREERALCYSVSASYGPNHQVGSFSIASSTNKELLPELLRATSDILNELKEQGLLEHELLQVQEQIRCGLLLGESDIDSRMHSILFDTLFDRPYRSIDKIVVDLLKVNVADIKDYIDKFLGLDKIAVFLMGNFNAQDRTELTKLSTELFS